MAPAVLDGSTGPQGPQGPQDVDGPAMLRSTPEAAQECQECQVCVVGAGPAGLMVGANLARMGIRVQVVDDRADPTPVGRWELPRRPPAQRDAEPWPPCCRRPGRAV